MNRISTKTKLGCIEVVVSGIPEPDDSSIGLFDSWEDLEVKFSNGNILREPHKYVLKFGAIIEEALTDKGNDLKEEVRQERFARRY